LRRLLWIPIILVLSLLFTSLVAPEQTLASSSELSKVNEQLKKVKDQMKKAEQAELKAKKEIERIRGQKKSFSAEVDRLEKEIATTSEKIKKLSDQIHEVEQNLLFTVGELDEAKQRVIDRDALLKSRVRLLYMHGFVTYLDVLMSSTSFADFLDRMDAIQYIVSQDKDILEANIRDRQLVEQKKQDIEAQLAYVGQLYAETTKLQEELETKRDNRETAIASLENKEQTLEEITEQQEKELMKLADAQAKLIKKQKEIIESNKRKVNKYTGGQLKWPVPDSDRITSYFGIRIHPITRRKHTHSGLDIGGPSGMTIVAAASGEVILAQWYGGFGNTVIIEHKDGFRTLYAHIRRGGIKVKVGETVDAGEKIAEIGSTGSSTGNHLHFGVYVDSNAVDPLPYLQ
jgi:murein DD-endopeptidase MepM/ murein hydrolase activator NlpD